jgi:hypothetical protein
MAVKLLLAIWVDVRLHLERTWLMHEIVRWEPHEWHVIRGSEVTYSNRSRKNVQLVTAMLCNIK